MWSDRRPGGAGLEFFSILWWAGIVDRSYFFFSSRRRHTSSLRDWSSDVCSSDLSPAGNGIMKRLLDQDTLRAMARGCAVLGAGGGGDTYYALLQALQAAERSEEHTSE